MNYKDFAIEKSTVFADVIVIRPATSVELRGNIYTTYNEGIYDAILPQNLHFLYDKFATSKHHVLRGFRASRVRNNGVSVNVYDTLAFLDQDTITLSNYFHDISFHKKPDIFICSNSVRFTSQQTETCSDEFIKSRNYYGLITPRQIKPIHSRYRKEYWQNLLCSSICFGSHGAKLRNSTATIGKADYHNPVDEKNSFYIKRKREVNRHNCPCNNGFDTPRNDIELFNE